MDECSPGMKMIQAYMVPALFAQLSLQIPRYYSKRYPVQEQERQQGGDDPNRHPSVSWKWKPTEDTPDGGHISQEYWEELQEESWKDTFTFVIKP